MTLSPPLASILTIQSSPAAKERLRPPRSFTEPSPNRSSTPTKSPKFSIFPKPDKRINPLRQNPPGTPTNVTNRGRPLKRSNTAPEPSPLAEVHDMPQTAEILRGSQLSRVRNQVNVMTPVTASTMYSSDSEDDEDEAPDTAIHLQRDTWRPQITLDEPSWEIVNPNENRKGSSKPDSAHVKTPSLDTMSSLSTASDLDELDDNTEIIKVSLARTVSVSKTKEKPHISPHISPPLPVLEPKRYVPTQPMTPTLVETNHRDRKSQQVKIESFS